RPEVFIIGSSGKKVNVSTEGKQFLEEKQIALRVLSIQEAVRAYNRTKKRKAILICINSNKKVERS
ncbi:MAG: Mth938-like domain-containing protein, partial [Candidatus Omnitrophica bacterium]|nr:Mth938-like domain-containing protein [Candidatus Omnitrophota bacterium]